MKDPQTFAAADEMYRSAYRTDDIVCPEAIEENKREFIEIVCQEMAAKDGLILAEDADEYAFESFWDDCFATYGEAAENMINGGLEFVYLVNYKGEGEGYATKEGASRLKQFISKYNYR